MPMMSRVEYAKHRGVTPVAVHYAIKAGRIKLTADGKIDQRQADKDWKRKSTVRARTGADAKKKAKPPAPPPPPASPPPAPEGESPAGEVDYFAERARRERAEADIAEFKAGELGKELVRLADVEREWSTIAGRIRETLLQLPSRLAPVLEMRPLGFVQQTLDTELRAALHGLAGLM